MYLIIFVLNIFYDRSSWYDWPSLTSKSLKATSEPKSSSSTSPLSVNIIVRSFRSIMHPTTSPACQTRPKCSFPWCQRWTYKTKTNQTKKNFLQKQLTAKNMNHTLKPSKTKAWSSDPRSWSGRQSGRAQPTLIWPAVTTWKTCSNIQISETSSIS